MRKPSSRPPVTLFGRMRRLSGSLRRRFTPERRYCAHTPGEGACPVKVAELMHRELKTISVDATIADAVDALTEAHVSALPVVDRFGRAVGVISTRDILTA